MAEGACSCQEKVDDGEVSLEMLADESNRNVVLVCCYKEDMK